MEYTTADILKEVVMMYKVANENANCNLGKIAIYQPILHMYKILGEYPNKDETIPLKNGTSFKFEEARKMLLNDEDLRTKFPVDAFGRWAESKLTKSGSQAKTK